MNQFNVLTYCGKKLMATIGFDSWFDATNYVNEQKATTAGLKFYLVEVLAMAQS